MFNQQTFLDYLKQVKKRLGKKVIMFTGRACKHQSNKVQKYFKENKDSVRIFYLPNGSPEFNAVEEC
jgi:transposase